MWVLYISLAVFDMNIPVMIVTALTGDDWLGCTVCGQAGLNIRPGVTARLVLQSTLVTPVTRAGSASITRHWKIRKFRNILDWMTGGVLVLLALQFFKLSLHIECKCPCHVG